MVINGETSDTRLQLQHLH